MPSALADALRLRAYRNISLISYHKLGEHAVLLGSVSGNVTGALSSSQDLSSCIHLVHIIVRLVLTVYTENSTKCTAALSALTKIGVRITNEAPSVNAIRLVAYISAQLRSICVELSDLSYITRGKEGDGDQLCSWKKALEYTQFKTNINNVSTVSYRFWIKTEMKSIK